MQKAGQHNQYRDSDLPFVKCSCGWMKIDYPVKPDGTVATMNLRLYFSEWRAKFHERQVQNKLAEAKRDASQQTKDSVPNAQTNVMTPPLPPTRESHNFPGI